MEGREYVFSRPAHSVPLFLTLFASTPPSPKKQRVEDISQLLVEGGYSYHGKDYLTSGVTGEGLHFSLVITTSCLFV
jgi:hypothetical protein